MSAAANDRQSIVVMTREELIARFLHNHTGKPYRMWADMYVSELGAAFAMGVSVKTLDRWDRDRNDPRRWDREDKKPRRFKIGGCNAYSIDAIVDYLNSEK